MNRKDQHIKYALTAPTEYNSFDDVKLLHMSLPKYALDEVDISTKICGLQLSSPFFINAMTGGSANATEINRQLAIIAKECDLLMFTGSYSQAFTRNNTEVINSFSIIRDIAPNILLGTNLGLDKTPAAARIAITTLQANVLQLHLNTLQELLMPEGEKNFRNYRKNLNSILQQIEIPIIVKETGFGMNYFTMRKLSRMGVKTVDISGRGGANFAYIENQRREKPIDYMNNWGLTTVQSLLESRPLQQQLEIIASGGISSPLDIIKAIVLGAKAVGIASPILKSLSNNGVDGTISMIKSWQEECKLIMCLLNCRKLKYLTTVEYVLYGESLLFKQQRNSR